MSNNKIKYWKAIEKVEEEDKFKPAGGKVIDPGLRVIRSNSGNEYDGEWNNNARNGKGKMVYKTGASYNGYYLENKRHGFGTFNYSSGNSCEFNQACSLNHVFF